ncbi:MAG: hypothetical protein C0524_10785 [Rhodobacter sp.]|nr:hypothetical protein [Rhodobacter sp.]
MVDGVDPALAERGRMFVIGGLVLGAIGGGFTARRRGGKPADMAQYAAGYGIAFGILGLFLTLILDRLLLG